jgi:ABC-type lipopolysaccharide export system ATPase subunit
MEDHSAQAAPISLDIPLISNQDVWMNIALIKQYHENISRTEAEKIALDALKCLGLIHLAHKRNPSLTSEEKFCVMLLRAVMVRDALVMIDRPFKIIPHLKDINYIFQMLKEIDDFYVTCHIYDYNWMAGKYGDL